MDYPIRSITHQIERQAIEILSKKLPKEWIVREMTERDYGIDLYLEIVNEDKKVTGDLLAIQIKGTSKIDFNNDGSFTFYGIKQSTLNYWLGLPVPVFFIVVCIDTENSYWVNVNEEKRLNNLKKSINGELHIVINKKNSFDRLGLMRFKLFYFKEKKWPAILIAIENSLMFYNSLGPFYLICSRKNDNEFCSTTVQYMVIQHFEYYRILSRYILGRRPKDLPYWYDRNLEYIEHNPTLTFSYKILKEFFRDFITDYLEAIHTVYILATIKQKEYFSRKLPFLSLHLQSRPLAFIIDDWLARYYFDEYESETTNLEYKFFEDFTDLDEVIEFKVQA